MSNLKITDTENPKFDQIFPFIKISNKWGMLESKYIYEDGGEKEILTKDAIIIS